MPRRRAVPWVLCGLLAAGVAVAGGLSVATSPTAAPRSTTPPTVATTTTTSVPTGSSTTAPTTTPATAPPTTAAPPTTTAPTTPPVTVSPASAIDGSCNGGRPVRVAPSVTAVAAVATVLADGVTVVAVDPGQGDTLDLSALAPGCQPDAAFGTDGTATLHFPGQSDVDVHVMAGDGDGSVLLCGSTRSGWLVARALAGGGLDPTFAGRGWVVLTPPRSAVTSGIETFPGATTVATAPSGSILVGGDDGAPHCCITDWIADLAPDGSPVGSFGSAGWARLAGSGSHVDAVVVRPDGSLLAEQGYESTGEGGVTVTELSPAGAVVEQFDARFAAAWRGVEPDGLFQGTVVARPGDAFTVVGAGNALGARSAGYGLAAGFLADGAVDTGYGLDGTTRFAAETLDTVVAVAQLADGTVVTGLGPVAVGRTETEQLVGLARDGAPADDFGSAGLATVTFSPSSNPYASALAGGAHDLVLTGVQAGAVYLVRLLG